MPATPSESSSVKRNSEPRLEQCSILRRAARILIPDRLRMLPRKLSGRICDVWYRIDTEGWYQLKKDDQQDARFSDGVMYQPCPYSQIWKVLKLIPSSEHGVFYDLGCGKGRALLVASASCRFRRCVGVELVPELSAAAQVNAINLRTRWKSATDIQIINGDCADMTFADGAVFFLFNPFGPDTIQAVLDQINRQKDGHPVTIACYGLYQRNIYDRCAWLKLRLIRGRIGIWESL